MILASQKARALLVYLAVEPPHTHSREKLSALLWPDQPPQRAAHNLRQVLTALRKAADELAPDFAILDTSRESIGLNPDVSLEVDAARFSGDLKAARHPDQPLNTRVDIRRLKKAAGKYHGAFLEGFDLRDSEPFEEWAMLQRESIHRQAIRLFELLLDYYQQRSEVPLILETAEKLLELAPWDEQIRRLLMTLYAQSGQIRTALSLYHTGKDYLLKSLDLAPSDETTQLYEDLRSGRSIPTKDENQPERVTNLPPETTPFIGRQQQLDDLSSLLARPDVQLVTIYGPGGIGKTRLALHAACEQVGLYRDGVYFIPLDAVDSADRILPLIAQALDIQLLEKESPVDRICSALRESDLLLILDNFEHLQEAGLLISQLLGRTRHLQIIITSRQQLNLQEEWTYTLTHLSLPRSSDSSKEILGSEAVDLFLQVCSRMGQKIPPGDENLRTIARICKLMEGFPLGIELAAATIQSLTLEEIYRQIESNLGSLTSPINNVPQRHRSLRAAFEHSWQLLNHDSRQSLRRLAVFHDSFEPELAAAVTGAVRQELEQLIRCSLLLREGSRFVFHPLVHQFALEKLQQDSTELESLQGIFAAAFIDLIQDKSHHLKTSSRVETLIQLQKDEENIGAAWAWALKTADMPLIEKGMDSLYLYYQVQSRYQEGLSAFSPDPELPQDREWNRIKGWLLLYRGVFARNMGRYELAEDSYTRAEALFQTMGEKFELAVCAVRLAGVALNLGQYSRTLSLCDDAIRTFEQHQNSWWQALATFLAGDAHYRLGKIEKAQALLEESAAFARDSGDPGRITASLNTLADVLCYQGDLDSAEILFRECLENSRTLQDHYGAAVHLNNLGTIFHTRQQWDDAAFAYNESLNICRKIGDRYGEAVALSNLGEVALEHGDLAQAHAHFEEGLAISEEINNTWSTLACLGNLTGTAFHIGAVPQAREHLARGLSLALKTSTFTMLPKLLLSAARIDLLDNGRDRAAGLIAQILYTEDIDDSIRQQAADLVQTHELTLPHTFTHDLRTSAEDVLQSLKPRE